MLIHILKPTLTSVLCQHWPVGLYHWPKLNLAKLPLLKRKYIKMLKLVIHGRERKEAPILDALWLLRMREDWVGMHFILLAHRRWFLEPFLRNLHLCNAHLVYCSDWRMVWGQDPIWLLLMTSFHSQKGPCSFLIRGPLHRLFITPTTLFITTTSSGFRHWTVCSMKAGTTLVSVVCLLPCTWAWCVLGTRVNTELGGWMCGEEMDWTSYFLSLYSSQYALLSRGGEL